MSKKKFSTREDDLKFDELDEYNKKIVLKHLKISGRMRHCLQIRNHLIKEIHEKKCTQKRTKFYPNDLIVDKYYNNYLHTGKKMISSWDVFPCSFQSFLENILLKEMTIRNFNFIEVYYGCDRDWNMFDVTKWTLSNNSFMTPKDIEIMECYRTRFIGFLTRYVGLINKYGVDKKKECEKELIRIVNAMNK